jgi:L-amino acid N-acyltransferase YncA
MSAFTTRRLTAADLKAYRAVRNEGLTNDSGSFRISVADDETLGDAAWQKRLTEDYVVAMEDAGKILAIGGFSRMTGTKASHKGLIWGMYVRPEARGKGVGDLIMNTLADHAKTLVRQLQLTVVSANPRAITFYQRHGFRLYGVEPESIKHDGGFLDEALMWRLL